MRTVISIDTRATVITLYRENKSISNTTFLPGGLELCEALLNNLKLDHQFLISRLQAEYAILSIGYAVPTNNELDLKLCGRNLNHNGLPDSFLITSSDVYLAIKPVLEVIAKKVSLQVQHFISLVEDNEDFDEKISLTGEYRMLKNLDIFIEKEVNNYTYNMRVKVDL